MRRRALAAALFACASLMPVPPSSPSAVAEEAAREAPEGAEPVPAPSAPAPAPVPEAAPLPAAADGELAGKPVAEVAVEGLVTVSADEVRRVMATRPGLAFQPATYREDFERIYNLGLFENVELEQPELTPRGVRVVVRVRERPIVDAVELRGNRKLGVNSLMEAARGEKNKSEEGWKPNPVLLVGGRYDAYVAHQMAAAFKALYVEKRYALARIEARAEPVPARPGHVVAVFDIVEERPVVIAKTVFRGRSELPEKKLLEVIQSKPGWWLSPAKAYDPDVLKLDALRAQEVYRNNGYSDARVTALPPEIGEPAGLRKRRRATVIFDVHEGRLYRYGPVSFSGLTLVSEDKARETVGLKLGAPYSEEEVYRAARRLESLLGEHGRPFAKADARRQDTAEAGVTGVRFAVSEGPEATVGEVRIKGNAFTRDRIIRRESEIFPGDIYDSRKVARTERNLRRRGLFEKVAIRPEPGDEPDVVDLEVEVKEQPTGMLNVGAFVSPDDGSVGGMFSIAQRNFDWRSPPKSWDDMPGFRGGGQSLSLRAAVSDSSQSYSIDFANPWIWDTPEHYNFGFSIFHTFAEYEDFEAQRTGTSVRLGRQLFDPRLRAYAQYKIQNVYLKGVDSDAPDVLQDEEGTTLFSSGEVGLTFDTLDDLIAPSKGVLLKASEEVFGGLFGGDHDIRKTELEGNGFVPIFRTWGWPHVLHARVLADWANPYGRNDAVPPSERFYAGGIGTVRGFESRTITPRIDDFAVGGDFMLVENFEYIFPLYQNHLRGVAYFDAGNVWPEEGEFAIHDQRKSYGFGLLIKTPPAMGQQPIKLYFSEAINPRDDEDTRFFQMSFSFLF